MADPLSGGIEAEISPRQQFQAAAHQGPVAPKPYLTIPVKPSVIKEIISNLGDLQGRTDDSKITSETANGVTHYAFLDTRTSQPLASMKTQDGRGTLTLYQSPEDLAKRIDSVFVSPEKINNFIRDSRMEAPADQQLSMK